MSTPAVPKEILKFNSDGSIRGWASPAKTSNPPALSIVKPEEPAEPAPAPAPPAPLVSDLVAEAMHWTEVPLESLELPKEHVNILPPQSPQNGALDLPEDATYGWAKQHADTLHAPRGWAYVSTLTAFASQGINESTTDAWSVRPTLYSILLGRVGEGKSVMIDRALGSLTLAPNSLKSIIPASDKGLQKIFPAPEAPEADLMNTPTVLLHSDEAIITFKKIAIGGSTLAPTFCTLYYKDEAGSADKTGEYKISVRLNMLGAVPCDSVEDFTAVFGAELLAGLYSRMIICPGPEEDWRWDRRWRPNSVQRIPTKVIFPDFAHAACDAWEAAGKALGLRRGRLADIARRVALISASANGDKTITPECITAALKFAEWQEKVKDIYRPSTALNKEAECANAILDTIKNAMALHANGTPMMSSGKPIVHADGWFNWRLLDRAKGLSRKYGGLVTRSRSALTVANLLIAEQFEGKQTGRFMLDE